MSSLFSGPKLPDIKPPARLPDPMDASALEARRRRLAEVAGRTGRSSTIMTGGAGDDYSSSTLGSTR